MPVKASYLFLAGAGGIIVYSGIKGKGISSAFRTILQGKSPSQATATTSTITPATYGYGGYSSVQSEISAATPGGSGPCSAVTTAKNMALGKVLAAPFGWSIGGQWDALTQLWNRESGWCNTIANASSGAYGIAQALPPTKYPVAGQQIGGSSAAAQITWGLQYILQRYGSPEGAWAHEVSQGWY
jgi:hypothetical protein